MNHGADVGDNTGAGGRATQARAVGLRLRAARKRVRLSLEAVESLSEQEFKTSALSAYERGERSITVPRLQRLAKLYGVPADSLLPADVANGHPDADPASWKDSRAQARAGLLANQEKVTIDLVKLDTLRGPDRDSLKNLETEDHNQPGPEAPAPAPVPAPAAQSQAAEPQAPSKPVPAVPLSAPAPTAPDQDPASHGHHY